MTDHRDPEFERDLDRSMSMFERAQLSDVARLEPRRPSRILVVFDGSDQDPTTGRFARLLKERYGCPLLVLDARERPDEDSREHQGEDALERRDEDLAAALAPELGATALEAGEGSSFRQILDAIDRERPDLVLLPSPFGRSLTEVGPDSTGSVIDVLLARSPVPIMVIREPMKAEGVNLDHVAVILSGRADRLGPGAAWALGLTARGGEIQLLVDLSSEEIEQMTRFVCNIDPDARVDERQVEATMKNAYARLSKSVGLEAEDQQMSRTFSVVHDLVARLRERPTPDGLDVYVSVLDRSDPHSQGRVHDHIRFSKVPVLVVPRPE